MYICTLNYGFIYTKYNSWSIKDVENIYLELV